MSSKIDGSFLRGGGYPLEADYIFSSEEELISFYSDPIQQALLHQGWLKIVGEGDNQALYWVVKEDEELRFKKLLENVDRERVQGWLESIQAKLIEGESAINNLQNDVKELQDGGYDLILKTNAIIGTDESDWKTYLNTLDYPSITALSKAVSKFLGTVNDLDHKIDTLPELQNFLDGYEDTNKLKDILQNLQKEIVGNVEEGTSLESVQRNLLNLIQSLNHQLEDLHTELNQTQTGVGLDSDGKYSPDKETYYLRDATSVMNALKTLDRLLHRQANVEYVDSDTIDFDSKIEEDDNVRLITADVKINPESDIIIKDNNGLYHKVELNYDNGQIDFLVNGETRASFNIGLEALVEESYYDKTSENIVLIFALHNGESQRIEIPATDLITEWNVESTSSIVLNKTRVVDGVDILTADINVSDETNNGVEIKNDGLFVSNNAKDIVYNDTPLDEVVLSLYKLCEWYEAD